jgi:hypothetical protein
VVFTAPAAPPPTSVSLSPASIAYDADDEKETSRLWPKIPAATTTTATTSAAAGPATSATTELPVKKPDWSSQKMTWAKFKSAQRAYLWREKKGIPHDEGQADFMAWCEGMERE